MTRQYAPKELEDAIRNLDDVENQISTLKEQLSGLYAERKELGEKIIPDLVEGEHLDNGVTLSDGREYTFERQYECGIAEKHKDEAHGWLAAHNADTILKRQLIIEFPKDSARVAATIKTMIARILPQYEIGLKVGQAPLALVDAVRQILESAGVTPTVTISEKTLLPGPTLTSFVKKSVKAGVNLPDCFGVYAPLRAIPVPATVTRVRCEKHGITHDANVMCVECYNELGPVDANPKPVEV
jgi:hypothetical protein